MKKESKKNYFVAGAVIILLVFLHFLRILSPAESLVFNILSPVLKYVYISGSKIEDTYLNQVDKRDLGKVVKELEEQNQKILSDLAKMELVEEENQRLRDFLDFEKKNNTEGVIADIVSFSDINIETNEDLTFTIDRGRNNGVVEGLAVLNNQGVVVGKIIKSRDSHAVACITTDKKCKFAVKTLSSSGTSGMAQGELGLTIKMDFIPQTEALSSGDVIVTSGLESNIPAGLVLGRVSSVQKENNDLWQSATIEPIDDFQGLTNVMVIKPIE